MKILVVTAILFVFGVTLSQSQTPAPQKPAGGQQGNPLAEFEHPKNLKVLPKNIKPEDLQKTMRTFSRSLGVRCGFCHAIKPAKEGERPELDFVTDSKPEKRDARKMYTMMNDINHKYLQKMDKSFEELTCVSCHHGSAKPMVSVDSLPAPMKPPVPSK